MQPCRRSFLCQCPSRASSHFPCPHRRSGHRLAADKIVAAQPNPCMQQGQAQPDNHAVCSSVAVETRAPPKLARGNWQDATCRAFLIRQSLLHASVQTQRTESVSPFEMANVLHLWMEAFMHSCHEYALSCHTMSCCFYPCSCSVRACSSHSSWAKVVLQKI